MAASLDLLLRVIAVLFDEKFKFLYLHIGHGHQCIRQRLVLFRDNNNASYLVCAMSFAEPAHVPQNLSHYLVCALPPL
jgi:hypothetical protein